jgi:protein-disulfide isomerase
MGTQTRKRKWERDLERKRRQQLYLLIGVIAVAVLVVGVLVLTNVSFTQDQQAAAAVAADNSYADLMVGASPEGMPQLGSNDAPMTIYEYSSFGCPHCMDFHDGQFKALLTDIQAGQVRFVFVPISNQFSLAASAAVFCAQDQGKFWEMHDILFRYLGQYGNAAFTAARITAAAQGLGLDENAFNACIVADSTTTRINDANALFTALADQYSNVTGTPTLTFNGVPPEWGSGAPSIDVIRQKIAEVLG